MEQEGGVYFRTILFCLVANTYAAILAIIVYFLKQYESIKISLMKMYEGK